MTTNTTKTANKPSVAMKPSKLSDEELANKVVLAISNELHVRVGVGPIWRQLNSARKKEIIDAWNFKIKALLAENR